MPSYRASCAVHTVRPGAAPEEVLPAAKAAVGSVFHVDAEHLDIVRGQARIFVRFTVDALSRGERDDLARSGAAAMFDAVDALATWGAPRLEWRDGGRWRPVAF